MNFEHMTPIAAALTFLVRIHDGGKLGRLAARGRLWRAVNARLSSLHEFSDYMESVPRTMIVKDAATAWPHHARRKAETAELLEAFADVQSRFPEMKDQGQPYGAAEFCHARMK